MASAMDRGSGASDEESEPEAKAPVVSSPSVTRIRAKELWEHVMITVLEMDSSSKLVEALKIDGYETVEDLCTIDDAEAMGLSVNDKLIPKNQRKKLMHLLWWRDEVASLRQSGLVSWLDWRTLDARTFEEFRQSKAVARARGTKPAAVAAREAQGGTATHASLVSFRQGHKRQTSNYKEFNGHYTQWRKVTMSWKANANVDGIGRLMEESMREPVMGSVEEQLYNEMNTWFFNMLAQRVKKGQALIIVRKHEEQRDGRKAYMEMVAYYERDSNLIAIRQQCQKTLARLKLTRGFPGGPAMFFEKFQDVYLDLEYAKKQPLDDDEKIGTLLASIEDERFFPTKETLINIGKQLDKPVSYDSYLNAFLTFADELKESEKNRALVSEAQGKSTGKKKSWRGGDSRKGKNGRKAKGGYIPYEEWQAMSHGDRKKIIANRDKKKPAEAKSAKSARQESNDSEEAARAHVSAAASSPPESGDGGASLREIFRSQMQSYTARAGAGKSKHTSTRLLIDSGANCGLAGRNMRRIEVHTGKFIDVDAVGLGLEGCQMGSYVTRGSTIEHEHVILHFPQMAEYESADSLLSISQCRLYGTDIDDTPQRHGGKQCITSRDGIKIPLVYRHGLVDMDIAYPTEEELDTLEWVQMVDEKDWVPPTMVDYYQFDETRAEISANPMKGKPSKVDYESYRPFLLWKSIDVVKRTFDATTRHARHDVRIPMRKHYKSRNPALNVRRLKETYATDTFFATTKALHGETMVQLYAGRKSMFTVVYGMKSETQMPETLQDFIREWGAMQGLKSDNAKAQLSAKVLDILRMYNIKDMQSEAYQQNQNYAENRIGYVKATVNILLDRTGSPANLWYLCMQYVVYCLNRLAHKPIDNRTPMEVAFGETPDISSLLVFLWHQPVYYQKHTAKFPESKEGIGKFVGIAENVGDALTFKILLPNGEVICRSGVRPVDDKDQNLRAEYEGIPEEILQSEADVVDPERLRLPSVDPDELLGKIFLEKVELGGKVHRKEVLERVIVEDVDEDEEPQYKVRVGDEGNIEDVMAESAIRQAIERQQILDEDPEVDPEDRFWTFDAIVGHRKRRHHGWEVRVKWSSDDEDTWEPLNVMAGTDPVTIAEYAKTESLLETPGWKRFKRYIKRPHISARVAKQVALKRRRTAAQIKFGFRVPRTYQEALRIDKVNGNKKWQEAIYTELEQLDEYKTFRVSQEGVPEGFNKIRVHFVFDVKHDGRHKARLVAGGHMTPEEVYASYSSVASLRSMRLVMFASQLNDQKLHAADIGNAYLEAFTEEKVCFIAGPEFGPGRAGKVLVIVKALYGLRTSGAQFHKKLAETMRELGYFPSKADPNIWMRETPGKWEYVCIYVDDLLIASDEPSYLTDALQKLGYKLKGVGEPEYHLGGDIKKVKDPEEVLTWGPTKYINRMMESYKTMFGTEVPKREVHAPLDPKDHPELDDTEFLDEEGRNKYQSMIGSLGWAVLLGRIDITCAVMTMSSFRQSPRVGHLERLKRIYSFLRNYKKTSIKFRTDLPDYSCYKPMEHDWSQVYGPTQEEIPEDAPEPRGKPVITTTFADANLMHDLLTGRSCTGVLHMVNKTPIDWFSKKQSVVETAVYGSEFVAARIAVEQIMDLRYTLRMLGIPIQGKSWLFCDNMSVVVSSSIPKSTIKKRHNALAFHRVREAIAAGFVNIHHIRSEENPADILTKFRSSSAWFHLMKPLICWMWRDGEKEAKAKAKGEIAAEGHVTWRDGVA